MYFEYIIFDSDIYIDNIVLFYVLGHVECLIDMLISSSGVNRYCQDSTSYHNGYLINMIQCVLSIKVRVKRTAEFNMGGTFPTARFVLSDFS